MRKTLQLQISGPVNQKYMQITGGIFFLPPFSESSLNT